jgi:hypothetical protein
VRGAENTGKTEVFNTRKDKIAGFSGEKLWIACREPIFHRFFADLSRGKKC